MENLLPASQTDSPVLKAGIRAYFDTFAGLIPCKVLSITPDAISIKLTAKRGAYQRGETIVTASRWHVVPQTAVYVRGGRYMIRKYSIGESEPNHTLVEVHS